MSLGYAEKLSYIEDVGKVGMKEHFDPPRVLHQKVWILHLSLVFFIFFFLLFLSYSCGLMALAIAC